MLKTINKIFGLLVLGLALSLSTLSSAQAASTTLLGNDISWPQCNKKLPTGQAFGIVGVNNGLANTTNPCLSTQLTWANKSVGGTGQPKVALYVNTANPELNGSWWPSSNTYGGSTVTNPYGTCSGKNDTACAFMYGYAKAYDDGTIRGISNPESYLWWLDVETGNSWSTNKTANAADLEGMVTYFQNIGAKVGIYSTHYQWGQIVGTLGATSNLRTLKSWIAGASSASDAKAKCTTTLPLTDGGSIALVQFVSKNLDYDYSCI